MHIIEYAKNKNIISIVFENLELNIALTETIYIRGFKKITGGILCH